MTDIKKGDRVKVTIEGVLTEVNRPHAYVLGDGHKNAIFSTESEDYTVTVEKIEPPVEVFKPGDVVRDRDVPRFQYLLTEKGYAELGSGRYYEDGPEFRESAFTSKRYEKVDLSAVS